LVLLFLASCAQASGDGRLNPVMLSEISRIQLLNVVYYTEAHKVILVGSFNGFNPRELEMLKTDKGWMLLMFLQMAT
jgi:hypothetical protein